MATAASEQYGQMTAAEIAREAEYARNLHRARLNQIQKEKVKKEKHAQKVASSIKSSRYTAPKTDAQKKQALKSRQRWYARKINARKRTKKIARMRGKYEKIIRRYARTQWTILYAAAFADAFFDVLTIPILSTALSFCTSLYINVALWGVGKKKERTKKRIMRAAISMMDLIPIINMIPFSVMIVYKAQENEKKRVRGAKKVIKKLRKSGG